jgi:hypothetical protein
MNDTYVLSSSYVRGVGKEILNFLQLFVINWIVVLQLRFAKLICFWTCWKLLFFYKFHFLTQISQIHSIEKLSFQRAKKKHEIWICNWNIMHCTLSITNDGNVNQLCFMFSIEDELENLRYMWKRRNDLHF